MTDDDKKPETSTNTASQPSLPPPLPQREITTAPSNGLPAREMTSKPSDGESSSFAESPAETREFVDFDHDGKE